MEKAGLICSGLSPDGNLVEIVELKSHPYFIASQFHPEFKSRPDKPHPLFVSLVKAAKANASANDMIYVGGSTFVVAEVI